MAWHDSKSPRPGNRDGGVAERGGAENPGGESRGAYRRRRFVGFAGLAEWFQQIGRRFDWSSVDWLDIHPYLGGEKTEPLQHWTDEIKKLRQGNPAQGIPPIRNPAYYSEWGGPSAVRYAQAHAGTTPDYFEWFEKNVAGADPVPAAGSNYFTLVAAPKFPRQGLTKNASSPSAVTELGAAFRARYVASSAGR